MNKTASSAQPRPASSAQPAAESSERQPARESNIEAIVAYVESGIKPSESHRKLGIEIERIPVHADMQPVSYADPFGVAWLLKALTPHYPRTTYDDHGDLLGVARPSEAVTIEPAAQVELSAGPFRRLKDAYETFSAFEDETKRLLDPHNEKLVTLGYHPTAKARDLKLIPKRRYQFMNVYLSERDTAGPCMMRGSASTQISIDYTSVADCLRKYRLAFCMAPVLALMCDNTPFYESEPRTHPCMRMSMWQHVDPDRCGLVPGALDPDFTLRDYAAAILDVPAILVPCQQNSWRYDERPFGEIYANRTMSVAEVEHAISMTFPDVRLKTFVEIRPADSMPLPYAIAYGALIKGLFYSEESLNALDELFSSVRDADYEPAQNAIMKDGYRATVYGMDAGTLAQTLVELAHDALDAEEQAYLKPLASLVERRVTLADMACLDAEETEASGSAD
ncbi:glutamate--cysteine ligase [Eggerthellaceae bacterium zg-893]|nr:glutamate--cysteine ligase [Eggerthellaceae bacterium zg-893]